MSNSQSAKVLFPIGEARDILKDLFVPNPWIYWFDFLLSMSIGLTSFVVVPVFGILTPWAVVLFLISVLALYRAAVFIHELMHFRKGTFRSFYFVWNLICGIPLLIPAFMYENHWDHHAQRHYGMESDGEYIPFARRSPWKIVTFLAASPMVPLLLLYRFLFLSPLAWVSARARQSVYRRASALQIDFDYVRRVPSPQELPSWRLQELGCFLFLLMVIFLLAMGDISPWRIMQAYLTQFCIVFLNSIRLLAAHRYRSNETEMSFIEQMLDSINYPRNTILTELWAPVGLRMHALHHLFPGMPYHSLSKAHIRLIGQLPVDSPYRMTSSPGLWHSLRQLWREAKSSGSNQTLIEEQAESVIQEGRL